MHFNMHFICFHEQQTFLSSLEKTEKSFTLAVSYLKLSHQLKLMQLRADG